MSRRHLTFLLAAAILLATLMAVSPAVAQDEWDGDEDQEQVDDEFDAEAAGADSTAGAEDEEEEERRGIGDGDPSQFQNYQGDEGADDEQRFPPGVRRFHPVYRLEHKRDQDVASWGHNFTMNYPVSRKVTFASSSNINTRTNDAANRLNRQETWTAGLNVKVSNAIGTGIDFRRTRHLDIQNEGKANETRSEREKESVKLRTSYEKTFLNGIDVALGANAGIEKNEYTNVKSRGATQGITGRMTYKPIEGLTTTFNYTGNHSLLDSEQGALSSTDESIDHDLSSRVDYNWEGHTFTVDMRRATGKKEYPKNEQTELKEQENESTGVTANINLVEGMTLRVGLDYSRNQQYYRVEPSRNSDVTTRGVDAHLGYDIGKTSFRADMGSDRKRNDYFDVQTGDNYTNTFSTSLSHAFSDDVDATLRARMSLLSVHYDDFIENDQDRDLYDQEASLTVNYKMRDDITTGLSIKVREDQLIYIRRTRTGDNKTTQKYSIEPTIRKTFTPRFSASQRYSLSADYTFYTYDEDSNFLIRNMSISTGLNWKPFDPLDLSIEHTYKAQDEGSYVKDEQGVEGYGRSSERADQTLGLTLRYKIADLVSIEVRQSLSVQDKWRIDAEGNKTRTWDKFDTSIVGKATTEYSLDDGTTLNASVARTLRDATSISDRQREVWNISVTLNRTF
jgi:hypothetical protein